MWLKYIGHEYSVYDTCIQLYITTCNRGYKVIKTGCDPKGFGNVTSPTGMDVILNEYKWTAMQDRIETQKKKLELLNLRLAEIDTERDSINNRWRLWSHQWQRTARPICGASQQSSLSALWLSYLISLPALSTMRRAMWLRPASPGSLLWVNCRPCSVSTRPRAKRSRHHNPANR